MKLLDLYCGGGLAAAGYWQSGCFTEIVGVDIEPDMEFVYPFDFVHEDALKLDYEFLAQFDFIHASPPCQAYSKATPKHTRSRHMRLIAATHLMLVSAGKPYVIENVPGSGQELRPNAILSGLDVGLPLNRPRYFHIAHEKITSCSFSKMNTGFSSQISSGEIINPHGAAYVSRPELIIAFGLSSLPITHLRNLTKTHIEQGIPPAMTRTIARHLFDKVMIG